MGFLWLRWRSWTGDWEAGEGRAGPGGWSWFSLHRGLSVVLSAPSVCV
uniref:Uncharacterized protein n=1 Tax=Anguilla anguilla TaxID=7936 RepID=A0A0E9VJD3_ANGAN